MMLSKRKARLTCNSLVEKQYPGYVLLMDRLSKEVYASLWGSQERRMEIIFPRKITQGSVTARIAHYVIS